MRRQLGLARQSDWNALPDHDKDDWLAYDWLQQKRVQSLQDMLNDRVENERSVEIVDFILTYLAKWGI